MIYLETSMERDKARARQKYVLDSALYNSYLIKSSHCRGNHCLPFIFGSHLAS